MPRRAEEVRREAASWEKPSGAAEADFAFGGGGGGGGGRFVGGAACCLWFLAVENARKA